MNNWISIFKITAKKIKSNSVLSCVPLKAKPKTKVQVHVVYLGM